MISNKGLQVFRLPESEFPFVAPASNAKSNPADILALKDIDVRMYATHRDRAAMIEVFATTGNDPVSRNERREADPDPADERGPNPIPEDFDCGGEGQAVATGEEDYPNTIGLIQRETTSLFFLNDQHRPGTNQVQ